MDVVITGIGLVSALGASVTASWQQLILGESSIRLCQPFLELKPLPLALIGQQPAKFLELTHAVVTAALADAGLVTPLPECGVVLGSSRSQQAVWEQLGRKLLTSAEFSDDWLKTLPHMSAIAVAHQVGTATAPVLAPVASCATGIWAIAQAFELIQMGQCQQAIAGAVEAPVTPLTLAGFNQMKALAGTGAYPFDYCREGLVLGEGAAVFVLESAEAAKHRSATIYGQVLGFGVTTDSYHVSRPEPGGRSALVAIKQCLDRSHLSPSEIDYIHAHGTATQMNDRNEAQLIQQIFPQGVPVSSTKGATGHTLGASGALGVAFCLMALKHQLLPPCTGLREPEFELDLVTAARWSEIRQVLCFSFGFGGQNAVLAIGKYFDD
ncbi:MAG: beta-ketoacyl-ACP synthase [Chroococcidiopsidaceae cyanobacterium CP_BM_RX_35]|nr:beta-ketoacyl-ACP synthase [Chroococcidiopsidaceae cyanobacterium CP_BM_RX_35]